MLLSDVRSWFERFERDVCGGRRRIRGRTFSGVRLEMYVDGEVVIVMEPAIEGVSLEARAVSLVKDVFDSRVLEAFLSPDRFERVVSGEEEIGEGDWAWDDES